MPGVPTQLGLDEGPLADARLAVIKAIQTAGLAEYRAAWRHYQRLAEAQIEGLSNDLYAKAQIGLIFAKAAIWLECHDRVRYWGELADAAEYAGNMGYEGILVLTDPALKRAATSRSFFAEYLQAIRQYDDAVRAYIEREQDECLTALERGLVNVRLTECYQSLLEESPPGGRAELLRLFEAAVQRALGCLSDLPEKVHALRLLEELEATTA